MGEKKSKYGGKRKHNKSNKISTSSTYSSSKTSSKSSSNTSFNKGKKRTQKGGWFGEVINQALVPFGLWGLQQVYNKRKTQKHKK